MKKFSVTILILSLTLIWKVTTTAAQSQVDGWSQPIDIFSVPADNTDRSPVTDPHILTDAQGRVHVFWSYKLPGSNKIGDYIMYTRLENGAWSIPNEIITSPSYRGVSPLKVAIDPKGIIHAVWFGQSPGRDAILYYSSAHVDLAYSTQNWSPPVELHYFPTTALVFPFDLFIDQHGILHLIAIESSTQPENFVYYQSRDGGKHWSEVAKFPGIIAPGAVFLQPTITSDRDDHIFLVWTSLSEAGYYDNTNNVILFSRSDDHGVTWSSPDVLADSTDKTYTYENANIIVDGSGTLHVVWNSSAGGPARYHRYSRDNGETWSEIDIIYVGSGKTQWPALALDSNGKVQMVSSGNAFGYGNALFYTLWEENRWAPLTNLAESMEMIGENPQIAIGLGSQLHLVWRNDIRRAISYSSYSLDSPTMLTQVIPTAAPNQEPTETAQLNLDESIDLIITATIVPADQSNSRSSSTQFGLVVGVSSAILLIVSVIFWSSRTKQK